MRDYYVSPYNRNERRTSAGEIVSIIVDAILLIAICGGVLALYAVMM